MTQFFCVSFARAAWRRCSRWTFMGSHRWLGPRIFAPQLGHIALAGIGAGEAGTPLQAIGGSGHGVPPWTRLRPRLLLVLGLALGLALALAMLARSMATAKAKASPRGERKSKDEAESKGESGSGIDLLLRHPNSEIGGGTVSAARPSGKTWAHGLVG